jgi:NAD(P)-dependent dehydrogenase (short-subunit alcohol dehydrogenase family)
MGRREGELNAAAASIGRNTVAVHGDVTQPGDLDALFAHVRARRGRIDVLFANAGVAEFMPLTDVTEAHIDKILDVNVKGTLFTVQKALPLMSEEGSIILTGSTAGSTGLAGLSVYGASKAAIRSFARNWILELKGTGIRVNILSPGPTETPGTSELLKERQGEKLQEILGAGVPLGRAGRVDEIAAAALFLASEDSSFVHGAELFADGGIAQI